MPTRGEIEYVKPLSTRRMDDAVALKDRVTERTGALDYPRSGVEDHYRAFTDLLHVAPDGSLDGFAVVKPTGYVSLLAVDPSEWRRGVGSELVDAVSEGSGVVSLHVREDNKRARRFYEAQGFQQVDRLADHYDDGGNALLMRRWGDTFLGGVMEALSE